MSAPKINYPPPTTGGTPVGGSGTVGTIPVWGTTTTTLTDSPLTVSGSNVTGAGAIRATGTSAGAPAFTGSDTDTGMYFPANNQVRFSTNGALAIAVDASQNVGIGTASPGAQLHVERTGGNVANTEYIRLRNTSGGNGSNATLAFQVAGNAVTTGSMSHTFVSASATYDTSFSVWNGSALGEAMRITGPTGNVGIGTASPGAQLHISRAGGTSNAEYIRLQNTTAAAGSAVGINFWQNNAATTVGRIEGTVTAGGSYDTAFYNWNGSALAEGMRLTGTGNVGIGTASPSHRLAVVGGDIFRHNTFTDASNYKGTRLSSATYSGAEYSTLTVVGIGTFASSNIGLVLQPLGTGAISAQMPDGTTAGGNARGTYAVDLQMLRTASTQVASGVASVALGAECTASLNSAVAIGYRCAATQIAAVAIGDSNTASGQRAVAIGQSNTASGANSVAIGQECVASTTRAVAIGYQNTASQIGSCALGYNTSAAGDFSMATGLGATARLYAARVHASGGFAANGDNQIITLVARVGTTDATKTALWLNGSSQRLVLPASTTWAATIYVTGRSTGGTDNAFYIRQCVIKRDGSNNTALVGTVQTIGTDIESNAAWDVEVTADDTNEALQIAVTGAAATTIRWVARVELVEVGLA